MTSTQINETAVHEAGHFLGCAHFQMRAFPEVTPFGFYSPSSTVPCTGVCRIPDPLTPYQACVVGWCGPLAQCLTGATESWMPSFKVTERTLRDWYLMLLARLEHLSAEDARMIRGGQGKIWLACKSAFKILSRDKPRLKRIARHLAVVAEKEQANPFSLKLTTPYEPMNATIPRLPEPEPMTDDFQLPETPLALPGRIQVLKNFLARMMPDDPERSKFQDMLARIERGEKLSPEIAAPGQAQ